VFAFGYSTADDGTGFGLRIVERVCEVHRWEVGIAESADGGLRVEMAGVETHASATDD
jgi:signal transduction histidine kinase